jgi:RNA polymerase sigma-70 factor (ECF subfamily)
MEYEEVTATRQEHEPTPDTASRVRELLEEHGPFVCRSLRRLGIAESDLDDMLQEVFLVVYQRLSDYEERNRARSWLYSICTRVAYAHRRKMFRRRESVAAELPESLAPATQLQSVEDREALILGHRLLALLSPEQREVFVLYEVEDMPMQQIATAIGCPLQTAYSRLHKARSRLLAEVERARVERARTDGESS